jgi:hypothetical protein
MVKNRFVVEVGDTQALKQCVQRLRNIESVFDAYRVTPTGQSAACDTGDTLSYRRRAGKETPSAVTIRPPLTGRIHVGGYCCKVLPRIRQSR